MQSQNPLNRRSLLAGGAAALSGLALGDEARALESIIDFQPPEREGRQRTLVLVQMFGGNDTLRTVVPYGDDAYYRARPKLNVAASDVSRIDDYLGFSPAVSGLSRLYSQGELAVVQGVGYPDPNMSHFKSLDIWHAARVSGNVSAGGWLGRLRQSAWGDDPRAELITHVGKNCPNSLRTNEAQPLSFQAPESYMWLGRTAEQRAYASATAERKKKARDGRERMIERLQRYYREAQSTSPAVIETLSRYQPRVEYQRNTFSDSLRTIASLIQSGFPSRVYSVDIRNFDTHGDQVAIQDPLLRTVDQGITAFLDDLRGTPAFKDTLVLAFSEFGRRVEENFSMGTDHGAAGSLFLAGAPVHGGLYGKHPSLTDLDENGNMIHNVDFRSVYASVIDDWFGARHEDVLEKSYSKLGMLG